MSKSDTSPSKKGGFFDDGTTNPFARQWIMALTAFIIICIILLSSMWTDRVDLAVGQVSPIDIQSPQRVINRYQTDALRTIEAERVVAEAMLDSASYIVNDAIMIAEKGRVRDIFSSLESIVGLATPSAESIPDPQTVTDRIQMVRNTIMQSTSVDIPDALLHNVTTLSRERLSELERLTLGVVEDLLTNERITTDDVPALRQSVPERLVRLEEPADIQQLGVAELSLMTRIAQNAVKPNLVLDLQRINRLQDAAARDVQPVYVERGQIIIRQYDLVTEEHVQLLQDLGLLRERFNYVSALGLVIIVAIMMGIFGYYLKHKNGGIIDNPGYVGLILLLLVIVTALAKTASVIPFEASGYLIPVALATMLIGILVDVHVAIISALFLSVMVGIVMGPDFKYMLVALTGGLTGALSVSRVSERSALARAGLTVGLVTTVTVLALGLFLSDTYMTSYAFIGLINGIASAVATIGFFPYLESLFGITSAIRLLELSNPNQPLLRKLLMESPGTYHHSMIVGNLAESAVEAIGGDSLLTRVGAMYHDIGKTKRPYFFIENQYGGDNPHDKLSPSLSTLILFNHVKDGVDMAKDHKLPEVVIAFIREHHGTTLVRYFYNKAKENTKEGESVDEKDFRYPGPKPQTRETAVVLLADTVEAAARSLNRQTPDRIEALVRKIVKDYLDDGQLDESNITLRDLDRIIDAFVQVLTGIHHKRVNYPESVMREMKASKT